MEKSMNGVKVYHTLSLWLETEFTSGIFLNISLHWSIKKNIFNNKKESITQEKKFKRHFKNFGVLGIFCTSKNLFFFLYIKKKSFVIGAIPCQRSKKKGQRPKVDFLDEMWKMTVYGRFHPGWELTAIELENFWFALKPINMWIDFTNSCPFVYVSIFLAGWSSSILLTSFTCWTCLKWPLNLVLNENNVFWGTFGPSFI